MAKKKPTKPRPMQVPPEPAPTWWERLTTRVSLFGVQEWVGAGVVMLIVALAVTLYVSR